MRTRNLEAERLLTPGHVTVCMGAQAGSEGKGNIAAWIVKHGRPQHLLSACSRNASHTTIDKDRAPGKTKAVFKVLPTGAIYFGDRTLSFSQAAAYLPKIWIGPGAAFAVDDLRKEVEAIGLAFEGDEKFVSQFIHIHPNATIVQPSDVDFENGTIDFHGKRYEHVNHSSGLTAHGTTGSGSGCARARKALRKAVIAREVPELASYVDLDFSKHLHFAIRSGDTALLDGSQGYMLSNNSRFYPHTTSRSTLLSSFLAEMDLSPDVLGHVVGVARTMPIRINSKRYFHATHETPLTKAECDQLRLTGQSHLINEVDSNSGAWYPDQKELTWAEVSEAAGYHVEPELTTLTKLPRRISTFSLDGLEDFVGQNRPPAPFSVHIFFTFANYCGASFPALIEQVKGRFSDSFGNTLGSLWASWSPEVEDVVELSRPVEESAPAYVSAAALPDFGTVACAAITTVK